MAVVCDDWQIVEAYKEGRDFHAETAKAMLTATGQGFSDPLTDAERQVGKVGNFAAIYSGGIPTIQRQLGCDKGTARRLADAFHGRYPKLGRWKWEGRGFADPDPDTLNGQIVSRIRERGYITTLWGRHLHPEEDRKALNALIQGGAADLMKQAMVRIHKFCIREGLRSHMVLSVHDEVGMDCVEDELPILQGILPELMGDETLEEILPITVDMVTTTGSWADAKE